MNSNVMAAVISAAGSMVVAITALVLNHRGFADLRSEMNARFAGVERGFADFRSEMNVRFGGVERRLELIEHRLDVIESDLKQFDKTLAHQDIEIARPRTRPA
jgi:hypothetical protein